MSDDKGQFGAADRLLIDDGEHNCRAFSKAGGGCILFPQVWNENRKIAGDGLAYVEHVLFLLEPPATIPFPSKTEDVTSEPQPAPAVETKPGEFVVKDSGERQSFESGMVRDVETAKTDYTTVFNGPMLDRWATHLTKGAQKYPNLADGSPNWMLAQGPAEFQRAGRSLLRHVRQYLRGDKDEDHAAAIFFNVNLREYAADRMAREGADSYATAT
jgi:hypothetical protein